MSEIPVSDNRGASGGQSAPKQGCEVTELPPLSKMSSIVEGLAATKSKSFGGEIGASLLAGSFHQLSNDLDSAKVELREMREQLSNSNKELNNWKQNSLVLEERVLANGKIRTLGNAALTLGSVLVGVAIELYRSKMLNIAGAVALVGVIMFLLGWFTGLGNKK